MFDSFERLEVNRNRNIEGTGLGLNITKRLLSLMGSSLEVESEYGLGSKFYFTLRQKVIKWTPIGDYMESYEKAIKSREAYREKFTAPSAQILVVDDTPMNLTVFSGLLKRTRVKIDEAQSGQECLEKSRLKKYDLIFLDHRMSQMDGIETLKRLKSEEDNPNLDTPIISLTANAVSGAREQYIAAGFDDYLTKPIISEKLESLMIRYLPGDKVTVLKEGLADEETNEGDANKHQIPKWLKDIEGINIEEGLKNCGDEEIYVNAFNSFAKNAFENHKEIERLFNEENIEDYTIKVHALKSSAKIIGAMQLSRLAETLEKAGDEGNIQLIKNSTDKLLDMYKQIIDGIEEKQGETAGKTNLPLMKLKDFLDAIYSVKELAESFDYDSIKYIINTINSYKVPEEKKQGFEKLNILNRRDFNISVGAAREIQSLSEVNHHRIDVRRTVNANLLFKSLFISPEKFAEFVSLRSLDAAQGVANDIFFSAVFVGFTENLLVIRHAGYAVAVLSTSCDNIGENFGINHRANAVMNNYNVVVRAEIFHSKDAIASGLLNSRATVDDFFQLSDIVLT